MNLVSDWRPASSSERVRTIDIIRGLALFGVLIVNILSDFRVPLLEHFRRPFADSRRADHLVDLLAAGALEFKALTIFSFLFGVGIAIQIERATSRNVNTSYFLLRRFSWLFVLGAASRSCSVASFMGTGSVYLDGLARRPRQASDWRFTARNCN
jgi:uncharacterized membrane protein YeiB